MPLSDYVRYGNIIWQLAFSLKENGFSTRGILISSLAFLGAYSFPFINVVLLHWLSFSSRCLKLKPERLV